MAKLTYVYDPLCGWCYGFVPALTHFAETHGQIEIDVLPGGLVTGARVGPYSDMLNYISGAAPKMTAITGQALGDAFFDMMRAEQTPLSISAPPSLAVLQMKALTNPQNVHKFVQAMLVEHFANGRDLNAPTTYDDICGMLDLPALDTDAIAGATEDHPIVAESFARARELGVSSFPTSIVWDDDGQRRGTIASIYDPTEFSEEFDRLLSD